MVPMHRSLSEDGQPRRDSHQSARRVCSVYPRRDTSFLALRTLMRTATVVAILAAGAHVTAETVLACSDVVTRQDSLTTMLKRMFQVASLEEWAFNENEEVQHCKSADGTMLVRPLIDVNKVDVLLDIANRKIFPAVFECPESALLSTDDGKGGKRYHIFCHGEIPRLEFAIRINLMKEKICSTMTVVMERFPSHLSTFPLKLM